MKKLRLLDFNVWSGLIYVGVFKMATYGTPDFIEKRLQAAIHQIKKLDPDIVCLHELNQAPYVPARIAAALDMNYYSAVHLAGMRIGPVGIPWNLNEADAIFVRRSIPFKVLGRLQLSGGFIRDNAAF